VYLDNDAKCGAMAEAAAGSLKDVADGIVLLFGTMIGCGIIMNHKLYKGGRFAAGEVSYIIPRPDNHVDYDNVWGNSGGTPRLCRMYAEKKGLEKASGVEVFDAVEQNDADAISSLKCYCHELAVQIFNLQTVLDPERIAIGGGISARPIFIDTLENNLTELYEQCPYPIPRAKIVPCTFRKDANLIGALQCFLENYKTP
ncbi:MAG: ROK family protein, partial [Oscillospiraceae bacterium]|nr:ROK family protein [Oscillospiraceae bacterium]